MLQYKVAIYNVKSYTAMLNFLTIVLIFIHTMQNKSIFNICRNQFRTDITDNLGAN